MAGVTPTASYAAHDRVLIAVVAEPRPLGIVLAGIENGWSGIRSIDEQTSQLKDKVRVGDIIERINCQDVRGWKGNKIGNLLEELYKKENPINIFLLRKKQAVAVPPGNNASLAVASGKTNMARAGDPELITPPAKRLKETPKNPSVASLPPSESVTASLTLAPNQETSPPTRLTPAEVRERMENDNAKLTSNSRLYVKNALARAYELHIASLKVKSLLETDSDVKSNPSLVEHFEESVLKLQGESQDILNISVDLFASWELHLLEFIKYMIRTGETSVINAVGDKKLNVWMSKQRKRRTSFENGNENGLKGKILERLQEDIAILDRVKFSWKGRETKSFDDYFGELTAYQLEHGNVNVPRLLPNSNLGEWIHRIRREYDDFLNGIKVPSLNPERIAALNDLGMIWKIRQGRPRKGDARFRLRRKRDTETRRKFWGAH